MSATPRFVDGVVYVASRDNNIYVLEAGTAPQALSQKVVIQVPFVEGGPQVYALSVSPEKAVPGGQIMVTWTAPLGHSTFDRVYLHEADASDDDDLDWEYVQELTGGTFTIQAPETVGEYELRYRLGDDDTVAATVRFVTASPSKSSDDYTVAVSPVTILPGGAITVTWTAPEGHSPDDWLALYELGAEDSDYIGYVYTDDGASGSLTIEGGYVNRCVNDIRRRPSQPLIQWRFHPHTVHRGRRLRSTQGPSDA